jgi:hypothetical protein
MSELKETLFYTEVSQNIRDEIEARQNVVNTVNRAEKLTWLYQRMLQVKVTAGRVLSEEERPSGKGKDNAPYDFTDGKVLAPPDTKGFENVYRDYTGYRPKPVLSNVKIREDGPYGSTKRATVQFKIFTFHDLDDYEANFFRPGIPIKIEYKWTKSASGHRDTVSGVFTGLISNFNYNVTEDGSFDCTFDCVGPGVLIKEFTTNGGTSEETDQQENQGDSEEVKPESNIVFKKINATIVKAMTSLGNVQHDSFYNWSEGGPETWDNYHNIAFFDVNAKVSRKEEKEDSGTHVEPYVSLKTLIESINQTSLKNLMVISCNDRYSKGHFVDYLISANPSTIIFPNKWNGDYSTDGPRSDKYREGGVGRITPDDINSTFGTDQTLFADGEQVRLGNILINYFFIKEKLKELPTDKSNIINFLNQIFAEISDVSGGIYNLTLISTDKDEFREDDISFAVVDNNYSTPPGKTPPKPLRLAGRGVSSILRNMSLQSKLPDGVAATAFVMARNPNKLQGGNTRPFQKMLGYADNQDKAKLETEIEKVKQDAIGVINKNALDLVLSSEEESEFEYTDVVGNIKTALQKLKENEMGKWNEDVLYPFNFSFTLDGIDGFIFGNVVETTWLPTRFIKKGEPSIVFTVTNVEHSFSGNDWTTTVNTVCRVNPNLNRSE